MKMNTKKFKKTKYILGIIFAILTVFLFNVNTNASDAGSYADDKKTINSGDGNLVDIIFTSDLHSYIESYDKIIDGKRVNVGGFARLKTFIDEKKKENPDTLLIDCGDVVMGTLPQALMDDEAYELRFLCDFGYDVNTFGNHEFDYGAASLANMYEKACKMSKSHPAFVCCNIDWDAQDEYTKTLKKAMDIYGYSDYTVLTKGNVKIAVTGVLGYDAIKCSPTCELTFKDPVDSVKETVRIIKEKENPDMIVCLSHSGTQPDISDSEDHKLAKEVPDLDVIISGHTHTVYEDAIECADTYILSCGSYGVYAGEVSLEKNSSGRWDLKEYSLRMMDESIAEDEDVLSDIADINKNIDSTILKDYGIKSTEVIAYNDNILLETPKDVADYHTEMRVGNLFSDAYRYVADLTPQGREHPFDMSVCPSGTIRGTFLPGEITVADAFEALSLGEGPDGNVGYPLVSLYLTGKEIRTIAEVDASISDLMNTARLYTSGVSFEYNPKRMILNKIVDVWLSPAFLEDSFEQLDDKKLYHITTDLYSMRMLSAVTDMSKGILSVVPKDEKGEPINDYDSAIIYDENGNELKAWIALEKYLQSFAANESGLSTIPDYYADYHGRKVVNASLSPRALFKNTSKYFYIVLVTIILIFMLIVAIIRGIVKSKHKKKVFKQ